MPIAVSTQKLMGLDETLVGTLYTTLYINLVPFKVKLKIPKNNSETHFVFFKEK